MRRTDRRRMSYFTSVFFLSPTSNLFSTLVFFFFFHTLAAVSLLYANTHIHKERKRQEEREIDKWIESEDSQRKIEDRR